MKVLDHEPDERALIEAARTQPARFAELYDRNFDRVYAFFARRVTSREEAQDLTAEVFYQALESLGNFKWQGAPFIAWLYGIAANVLSSHWRKLGKSWPLEDVAPSAAGDEIERSVMLGELVDQLSPDQRHVLVRRFVDQRSIRDIAQELKRSEGAIKQLQLRALGKMRELLGETL